MPFAVGDRVVAHERRIERRWRPGLIDRNACWRGGLGFWFAVPVLTQVEVGGAEPFVFEVTGEANPAGAQFSTNGEVTLPAALGYPAHPESTLKATVGADPFNARSQVVRVIESRDNLVQETILEAPLPGATD